MQGLAGRDPWPVWAGACMPRRGRDSEAEALRGFFLVRRNPGLHELLAWATRCEIETRPYRLGYQLILDQNAVDRLAELLQPAAGTDR